jgi:dihydroorotase
MEAAARINKPIMAHAEDDSLADGGVIRAGEKAVALGLPGIPSTAESSQVARDLLLAREAHCRHYHVCHISNNETLELITHFKKRYAFDTTLYQEDPSSDQHLSFQITCEVTPHHLLLNTDDIISDQAQWKMNPPLADPLDQIDLISALRYGEIDLIATDHAPHSEDKKNTGFLQGAFGVVGLEYAFSLLYTKLVKIGLSDFAPPGRTMPILTLEQLINLMSTNPARIFGLAGGKIEIGAVADLAIFALDQEQTIEKNNFESKSWNTPFLGQKVFGVNLMTFVDGKLVWKDKNQ